MATLSGWRHDMQRLWTLSQGPKPDAPRQPKTWSSNLASRPTATTRSRDDRFGQQKEFVTLGINETAWRSYLCHRHDFEWHMSRRRSLQWYRRPRWMQWMSGIQQQSQQDGPDCSCTSKRQSESGPVPGSTRGQPKPVPARAKQPWAQPSAGGQCHGGLSELWYDNYAIVETRRQRTHNLQCLRYVWHPFLI
jgi:hypothetical protein